MEGRTMIQTVAFALGGGVMYGRAELTRLAPA
jgi:hypothetical protein